MIETDDDETQAAQSRWSRRRDNVPSGARAQSQSADRPTVKSDVYLSQLNDDTITAIKLTRAAAPRAPP